MKNPLLRSIALLLVPCLLADPVTGSAFSIEPPIPRNLPNIQHRFQQQALLLPVASALLPIVAYSRIEVLVGASELIRDTTDAAGSSTISPWGGAIVVLGAAVILFFLVRGAIRLRTNVKQATASIHDTSQLKVYDRLAGQHAIFRVTRSPRIKGSHQGDSYLVTSSPNHVEAFFVINRDGTAASVLDSTKVERYPDLERAVFAAEVFHLRERVSGPLRISRPSQDVLGSLTVLLGRSPVVEGLDVVMDQTSASRILSIQNVVEGGPLVQWAWPRSRSTRARAAERTLIALIVFLLAAPAWAAVPHGLSDPSDWKVILEWVALSAGGILAIAQKRTGSGRGGTPPHGEEHQPASRDFDDQIRAEELIVLKYLLDNRGWLKVFLRAAFKGAEVRASKETVDKAADAIRRAFARESVLRFNDLLSLKSMQVSGRYGAVRRGVRNLAKYRVINAQLGSPLPELSLGNLEGYTIGVSSERLMEEAIAKDHETVRLGRDSQERAETLTMAQNYAGFVLHDPDAPPESRIEADKLVAKIKRKKNLQAAKGQSGSPTLGSAKNIIIFLGVSLTAATPLWAGDPYKVTDALGWGDILSRVVLSGGILMTFGGGRLFSWLNPARLFKRRERPVEKIPEPAPAPEPIQAEVVQPIVKAGTIRVPEEMDSPADSRDPTPDDLLKEVEDLVSADNRTMKSMRRAKGLCDRVLQSAKLSPDKQIGVRWEIEALCYKGTASVHIASLLALGGVPVKQDQWKYYKDARRLLSRAWELAATAQVSVGIRLSTGLLLGRINFHLKDFESAKNALERGQKFSALLLAQAGNPSVNVDSAMPDEAFGLVPADERAILADQTHEKYAGFMIDLREFHRELGRWLSYAQGEIRSAEPKGSVSQAKEEDPDTQRLSPLKLLARSREAIAKQDASAAEWTQALTDAREAIVRAPEILKQKDWIIIEGSYLAGGALRRLNSPAEAKESLREAERRGRTVPLAVDLRLEIWHEQAHLSLKLKEEGEAEKAYQAIFEVSKAILGKTRPKGSSREVPNAQWSLISAGQGEGYEKLMEDARGLSQEAEGYLRGLHRSRAKAAWDDRRKSRADAKTRFDAFLGSDVLGNSLRERFQNYTPTQFWREFSNITDRADLLVALLGATGVDRRVVEAVAKTASTSGQRSLSMLRDVVDLVLLMDAAWVTQAMIGRINEEIILGPEDLSGAALTESAEAILSAIEIEVDLTISLKHLSSKIRRNTGETITVRVPRTAHGQVKQGDVFDAIWRELSSRESLKPYLYDKERPREFHLFVQGLDVAGPGWRERLVSEDSEFGLAPAPPSFPGSAKKIIAFFFGSLAAANHLWAAVPYSVSEGLEWGEILGWAAAAVVWISVLIFRRQLKVLPQLLQAA